MPRLSLLRMPRSTMVHGALSVPAPAPAPHRPAQHLPKEEPRMLVSMSHSSDRTDKLQQPATFQSAFNGHCPLPGWRRLLQGPWGSVPIY